MANVDKLLMAGETIKFRTRPHWRFILAGCVIAALVIPVWVWLYLQLKDVAGDWATIPNIVLALIVIAVLLRYSVKPVLAWLTTTYVFSDRRVMSRSGVLHRRAADIPLDKVSNIYYDQTLFDRALHCGTLKLDSSGGDGFELKNVPNVERITTTLHELVELAQHRAAAAHHRPPDTSSGMTG